MLEKDNKKFKSLLPQVLRLINQQFIDLGNFMGDLLLLLELKIVSLVREIRGFEVLKNSVTQINLLTQSFGFL